MDDLPDKMFLTELEQDEDGRSRQTLSFSRSPTVLLNFAANRFTRNASRHYQNAFGIGAMDWRMLVTLTRDPGSSVSHASATIGIDKGAVSRSLARLEKEGLAKAQCNSPDERRTRAKSCTTMFWLPPWNDRNICSGGSRKTRLPN